MIRGLKMLFWALFMAYGTFLIVDGKWRSDYWLAHVVLGGAAGLVLGYLFSRKLKRSEQTGGQKLT